MLMCALPTFKFWQDGIEDYGPPSRIIFCGYVALIFVVVVFLVLSNRGSHILWNDCGVLHLWTGYYLCRDSFRMRRAVKCACDQIGFGSKVD